MKALIAMSGGVDSSLAAKLTLDQGIDCIGCTMKLYEAEDTDLPPADGKTCCSLDDTEDARSVAFRLGMPFYVFNYKEEFKDKVMSEATKYDHFGFVDFTEPLFDPSNKEIGPHTTVYGMTLERRAGTPVLLETLVYHYVRIGCPTKVNVRCTADGMTTDGYANWSGVDITTDPHSMWNGLKPEKWVSSSSESGKFVKDMKVPVEYTGTYEEEKEEKEEKPVYTVTPGYADLYFKDVESSETGSITISSDGTVTLNVPAHTTLCWMIPHFTASTAGLPSGGTPEKAIMSRNRADPGGSI